MTLEFEENILRYLANPSNKNKKFIAIIEEDIFEVLEHKIVFKLLTGYIEDYRCVPTQIDFVEYTSRQMEMGDVERDISKAILRFVKRGLYKPVETSGKFLKETIVEFAQFKLMSNMFVEYAPRLIEGVTLFRQAKNRMLDILALSDDDSDNFIQRGGDILVNGGLDTGKLSKVLYTPYQGLNMTMGSHGITSPELVVLMAGSKAFKTGVMINIAIGMAKRGSKVYYADGENGYKSISQRVKQNVCECTKWEVVGNAFEEEIDAYGDVIEQESVSDMFEAASTQIKMVGGAFVIDSYAPSTATVADVEDSLEQYKEETGFEPDIIFWDDSSHFIPRKPQGADHLDSQRVIKDIIGLNMKLGCASFTPAQVTRDAVDKPLISIKDIGRDYGIVKYAHVILSIIRSVQEREANLAQLYSVVQREGKSQVGACMLKFNEERMQADEVSWEEAAEITENMSDYTPDNVRGKKSEYKEQIGKIKRNK